MRFVKRTLALFVIGIVFTADAAGAEVNADAIAKVKAGQLTEAKASWWGFDPVDSTKALQAAVNSGAKRLIVENMGKPWIVTPISLAGDQEIVFERGTVVEAKKGAFQGSNDALFHIILKKNVSLIGPGAVLRMHRWDYDKPPYKKAEWRHVLDIKSSQNIKIVGLTLAESGGDGIYLGKAKTGVTNENVLINDVVCDGNYRQGISVITARNLLIENTVIKNTDGTAPRAGIDFEPNSADEELVNCVMRDCVSENNAGCGYVFYLPHLTGKSAPLSVKFENCIARGSNRSAFAFITGNEQADGPLTGRAEFVNCTFADGKGPGVTIASNPASGVRVRFVKCRIVNPAVKDPAVPPILFRTRAGNTLDVGGVDFENCVLEDAVKRPIMQYMDWSYSLRLIDVTGTLTVVQKGQETRHKLTQAYLDSLHEGKILKRFPRYKTAGVRFVPASPAPLVKSTRLHPFSLRRKGEFVIHASAGDEVTFTLRQLQVGRYGGQPMKVKVVAPSGKTLSPGSVPFQDQADLRFQAPETGLYRVPLDAGMNRFQMTAANRPACISCEKGPAAFIGALGDLYFYVPAGTPEFGVRICGEGKGEAIGAELFDPAGRQFWNQGVITLPDQFTTKPTSAQTGKVWRLRLKRPRDTTMEDFSVQLQGIPLFLAPAPECVLKPAE